MAGLRVLFVNHSAALGGGELTLPDLVRPFPSGRVILLESGPLVQVLGKAGISVEVLAQGMGLATVPRDAAWWRRLAVFPAVLLAAARLAWRARPFDVVYANSQKAMLVCALACRLTRRPLVWHLHDLLTLQHFSSWHIQALVWLANRSVRRVIATSQAAATAWVEAGGRADRVSVVYLGVDGSPYETSSPDQTQVLRTEAGCRDGELLLGLFSRLAPWKGQHVMLEALPRLPRCRILVVGDALFGEQAYAASLRALADRLGIADRVSFLGFRRDIPVLMAACDVIVHTSIQPEPFGRVLVEGMLAARPVVATAAGGPLEILEDERQGLLIPPNDQAALVAALERLRDPLLRERLGVAGRARARADFSLSRMAAALQAALAAAVRQDFLRGSAGPRIPGPEAGLP